MLSRVTLEKFGRVLYPALIVGASWRHKISRDTSFEFRILRGEYRVVKLEGADLDRVRKVFQVLLAKHNVRPRRTWTSCGGTREHRQIAALAYGNWRRRPKDLSLLV
jgi:hypothetical protein